MRRFLSVALFVLATGCVSLNFRQFEESKGAQTFENWRIYVHAQTDMTRGRTRTPDSHNYSVGCMAWTCDGDVYRGPTSYRRTEYSARINSLRILYSRGDDSIAVPLNELNSDNADNPFQVRLWQNTKVPIPSGVRSLLATVTITFTNKITGKPETKEFEFIMEKREGTKMYPLTV